MAVGPQTSSFGDLAVQMGLTTRERMEECLRIQAEMLRMGLIPKKIGQILVEKGYCSEDQLRKVGTEQGARRGTTTIRGYEVLGRIGQGAMGSVFRARQVSMDRIVALKILAPRLAQNKKLVERFLVEARAVARLNHPNIIQGIDVGVSNGVYYFAMEHVDGPTAGEILKRGGAMDERRALKVATEIARALDHADEHGMVHRDVKPDNIMLPRGGQAKLCDLGLAKMGKSGAHDEGSMGTPNYISPEQARGEVHVDIRSDIYSLGASFFHLLTGEVPFPSQTAAGAIARHISDPVPSPRERNPLVSPPIEAIVQTMLQKDPEDRYQSPEDLLVALDAAAKVIDPDATPPPRGRPGSAGRHVGRHRSRRRRRRL